MSGGWRGGGGIPVSSDTGIRRSRILFIANFKLASSFLCVQLKIKLKKKISSKNKQMINLDENTKEVKIYNIYTYYMTFMVYVQKIFMYHS